MNPQRIGGIVLLAFGVILLIIGISATDSFSDRWSNFFTGQFTDRTVWTILGGVVLSLAGLGFTVFGQDRALA